MATGLNMAIGISVILGTWHWWCSVVKKGVTQRKLNWSKCKSFLNSNVKFLSFAALQFSLKNSTCIMCLLSTVNRVTGNKLFLRWPYLYFVVRNRHQEMDLNLMPRKGMQYERCVMIIANPYTEDSLKKYNSIEMLLPKTGDVVFLTKLPQSLYTPGMLNFVPVCKGKRAFVWP